MKSNFAQQLFEANSARKNKPALVDDANTLTFSELETHALAFASHLLEQKLQPQDRVIFYFDDCVEWPTAFLSCLLAGLNPVCVNHNNTLERVEYLIDLVDAKAIITDKNLRLNSQIKVFSKEEILSRTAGSNFKIYQYHDDEPCFWLLTSGTTGHPKAIVHRHKNLINYRDSTNITWGIKETSKVFATAKLSFTYGLHVAISMSLPFGATVHLMKGTPSPTRIFDYFDTYNITNFYTVPTIINSIFKHAHDRTLNHSVKDIVSAGESLPSALSKKFREHFGVSIRNSIGMSELTSMYLIQSFEDYEDGSIGKPFPGIECKVVDDVGNIVPDGIIGELYVKSECMASMYWKDWKYTKHTFVGEWLRTGDKVVKSPTGNYFYVSRADDQIKINGQFVSSVEVESVILELPGLHDCVVVFKTSNDRLPEIHSFVVVDDVAIDKKRIVNFLSERLPAHKIPKNYHFINEIPKTLTNKKMRYELRKKLYDEDL